MPHHHLATRWAHEALRFSALIFALASLLSLSACGDASETLNPELSDAGDPGLSDAGGAIDCVDDSECAGASCVDGRCLDAGCSDDDECPDGRCVDRECAQWECAVDDDCAGGSCIDRACVPYECDESNACDGGAICHENACVECTSDAHCPDGTCVDNACTNFCSLDEHCTDGACVDGVCEPYECSQSRPCGDGMRCEEHVCVECTNDAHCPDGTCVENVCIEHECSVNKPCPGDGACLDNVCVECVEHASCPIGACVDNACTDTCSEDAHCTEAKCESGVCEPYECTANSACGFGFVCVDHDCEPATECTLGAEVTTIQEAIDVGCIELHIPEGTHFERDISVHRSITIIGPEIAPGAHTSALKATIDAFDEETSGRHFDITTPGITLRLENLKLINGRADKGGSIRSEGAASVRLELIKTHLEGNEATEAGGAIFIQNGVIEAESCSAYYNKVHRTNFDVSLEGGLIAIYGGELNLVSCDITMNNIIAEGRSGDEAILIRGGAILSYAKTTLNSTYFSTNEIKITDGFNAKLYGGGLAVYEADTSIENSTFFGNAIRGSGDIWNGLATGWGGAIYQEGGAFNFDGNDVQYNQLRHVSSAGDQQGGAISLYNVCNAQIKNGLFEYNSLINGGGIRSGGAIAIESRGFGNECSHYLDNLEFIENFVYATGTVFGGALVYFPRQGTHHLHMNRVLSHGNRAESSESAASAGPFAWLRVGAGVTLNTRIVNSIFSFDWTPGMPGTFSIDAMGPGSKAYTTLLSTTVYASQPASSNLVPVWVRMGTNANGANEISIKNSAFGYFGSIFAPTCAIEGGATAKVISLGYNYFQPLQCNSTYHTSDVQDFVPDGHGLDPVYDDPSSLYRLKPSSLLRTRGEPGGCTDENDQPITVDQRGHERITSRCTIGGYSPIPGDPYEE